MTTRVSRPLVLGTLCAMVLASCGGEESPSSESALRPPVAVEVAAVGGADGLASASLEAADQLLDSGRMGWFVGYRYQIGDGLNSLPTNSTGYQYPAGSEVDAAVVTRLGAALGVQGDPVRGGGATGDGVAWRIGIDDGSESSLTVLSDGQLSWYRSSAWQLRNDLGAVEMSSEGISSEELSVPREVAPPAGILTAAQAEARTIEILDSALVDGYQVDRYQLESFADEWFASVTVYQMLGGVRAPFGWNFGFGAEGALDWASGTLATPVPAGPYPLIDLDQAVQRLEALGGGDGVAFAEPMMIETQEEPVLTGDMAPGDMATGDMATGDMAVIDPPAPGEVGEPIIETAVLVEVAADLWWAWDRDGSVWLLPAYRFTDTEGRTHTVPAVADEFLIQTTEIEPVDPIEPDPTDAVDSGSPVDDGDSPDSGDAVLEMDLEILIGMPVEKAETTLGEAGGILRVLRLDGEDLAGTMDLRPNRVNVAVQDEVVTEILSTG